MGAIAWVMMALAIWHFTIFVPDKFWAGIVGGFLGAIAGSLLVGLALHGFSVPGRDETDVITALEGIPGAVIGLAVVYAAGYRASVEEERAAEASIAGAETSQ